MVCGEVPEVDVTVVDDLGFGERSGVGDLGRLVRFVLAEERQAGLWSVSVVLTDDPGLRRLHREFMGLDTETDVMTFPLTDGAPAPGDEQGGDVVVSVDRAAAQGPEHGHTTAAEVRFLVVHGLLHLCGWDDATEDQRAAMVARQAELLARFDQAGGTGQPGPPSSPRGR